MSEEAKRQKIKAMPRQEINAEVFHLWKEQEEYAKHVAEIERIAKAALEATNYLWQFLRENYAPRCLHCSCCLKEGDSHADWCRLAILDDPAAKRILGEA